jgi:hypothetical protein
MSNLKKQNRLQFTLNHTHQTLVEKIEHYYQEPVSKILLDDAIEIIKKRAAALPVGYQLPIKKAS